MIRVEHSCRADILSKGLKQKDTTENFGPAYMSRYASTSTDLCWATIIHEGGREEHDIRSKATILGPADGPLQRKSRTGISKVEIDSK